MIENFKSEDAMLLALIETNLIQRGSGNTNPIKLGRCLNELDRIYGVKRGNNQHRNPNNLDSMVERKSKKEITGRLGLSQETLTNYQKLTTLDEELQQMVLDGGISVTNAVKVAKKIQKEKQKDIVGFIREKGKIPGVKIDEIGTSANPEVSGVETDIMEAFAPGKIAEHNNHYNGYGVDHQQKSAGSGMDLSPDEYHTFGMLWEEDGYTFFVDGVQDGEKITGPVSHIPQFILISTEVRGYRSAEGVATEEAKAAAKAGDVFIVDYVRVFDEIV